MGHPNCFRCRLLPPSLWFSLAFPLQLQLHQQQQPLDAQRSAFLIAKCESANSVWQLLVLFPDSFGFNELFLVTVAHHSHSARFGTFLFNSQQERRDHRPGSAIYRRNARQLRHTIGAVVQGRTRTLRRPVAENCIVTRIHAQ